MKLHQALASLTDAKTWHFESARLDFPSVLTIRLVEGIAGDHQSFSICTTRLVEATEIAITPMSRVVDVIFDDVWKHDASREGRECIPQGERIYHSAFLAEYPSPEFGHLWSDSQMTFDRAEYQLRRWFVWSEDVVLYVVQPGEPRIVIQDETPANLQGRGRIIYVNEN